MARARTKAAVRPSRQSGIETALRVGKCFDWVSPVLAIANDIRHRGGHTFLLTDGGGLTGRQVIDLLRRRGIKVWGCMVIGETLTLTVRKRDARRASRILTRAGVS